ncbi:MAG: reverse transcriptase domain-containing protein, partial [Candidatus Anstonellales archaeon]
KINKTNGTKKIVYRLFFLDEFLFKVINKIFQQNYNNLISPLCFSFQKNKNAKTAFKEILKDKNLKQKFCLRLDIKNFFNSININDFFNSLHLEFINDLPLLKLLEKLYLNNKVIYEGKVIFENNKGLMAGTPLAPFFSNIYLKSLDDFFVKQKVNYARYADDIIVFDNEKNILKWKNYIVTYLLKKGLQINEEKTKVIGPAQPWEYLGIQYHNNVLDLSSISLHKLKAKIRRLTKKFYRWKKKKQPPVEKLIFYFIKKLNKKFYGNLEKEDNKFCWAQWFLPLLNTHKSLKSIDAFVQEKIRFLTSGKYRKKNYKIMPYNKIQKLGYLPLTKAYYEFKKGKEKYFKLINKRTNIQNNL